MSDTERPSEEGRAASSESILAQMRATGGFGAICPGAVIGPR